MIGDHNPRAVPLDVRVETSRPVWAQHAEGLHIDLHLMTIGPSDQVVAPVAR